MQRPSMFRKGITTAEAEREIVRLGGTVTRDKPDHVVFRFPGLPAVGVHCNRDRAPRRLVSMLIKAAAGKVVTAPRAEQAPAPATTVETPKARPHVPVRPNPPRPSAAAAVYDADAVAAEIERIREAKQRGEPSRTDLALARAIREAEVIVGDGWEGARKPGTRLVWYGQEKLEAAFARGEELHALMLNLHGLAPGDDVEFIDMVTRLVGKVKGHSDLLFSHEWPAYMEHLERAAPRPAFVLQSRPDDARALADRVLADARRAADPIAK